MLAKSVLATKQSFTWMCLFIGLVSIYDGYLVLEFAPLMHETEQNPIGKWLIQQDGGDVQLFLQVKAVGTAMVLASLAILHYFSTRIAQTVVSGIAAFQFLLLLYLTLYIPDLR